MPRKTILITGASAGIGAATARLAAQQEFDVAIHYYSDKAGAESVAEMCQTHGAKTHLLQGNVSDPKDITRIFAELDELDVQLDALVNNAGIIDMSARVDEMSFERLTVMTGVNLIGPIFVAKEAILRMSTLYGGEGGTIVNVSSMSAILGAPNRYVDYAATKGGIDSFTKGLALEVANEGIRVNGVRPGIIDTAIHAKGGVPDRAEDVGPSLPMKRSGTPQEVAQAILFLLSPEASYITGSILDVSGGR